MPKLSNARRYRRQHNLAGYCVNQTLRKVSEEDIQEQDSSTSLVREGSDQEEILPILKRREPSTCLSDLCLLSPMVASAAVTSGSGVTVTSSTQTHIQQDDTEERTLSPVWGQFIDVILDEDGMPSPYTTSSHSRDGNEDSSSSASSPVWLPKASATRTHSPYGESARKRLRIRSPARPNINNTSKDLDGFILQDPARLHEALSRLSV